MGLADEIAVPLEKNEGVSRQRHEPPQNHYLKPYWNAMVWRLRATLPHCMQLRSGMSWRDGSYAEILGMIPCVQIACLYVTAHWVITIRRLH